MKTRLQKLELTWVGKETRVGLKLDGFKKVRGKPVVGFQYHE